MKKLSKEQEATRTELVQALNDLASDMSDKLDELNDTIGQYNTKLEETREFVEETRSAMDDYADERSDAWRESEAGEAYFEWKYNWDIDTESLEEVDMKGMTTHAEELANLSAEPNS